MLKINKTSKTTPDVLKFNLEIIFELIKFELDALPSNEEIEFIFTFGILGEQDER